MVKNLPAMQETQETWVQFLGWDNPLQGELATHSSILAWRTGSLGRKESDRTEQLSLSFGLPLWLNW